MPWKFSSGLCSPSLHAQNGTCQSLVIRNLLIFSRRERSFSPSLRWKNIKIPAVHIPMPTVNNCLEKRSRRLAHSSFFRSLTFVFVRQIDLLSFEFSHCSLYRNRMLRLTWFEWRCIWECLIRPALVYILSAGSSMSNARRSVLIERHTSWMCQQNRYPSKWILS